MVPPAGDWCPCADLDLMPSSSAVATMDSSPPLISPGRGCQSLYSSGCHTWAAATVSAATFAGVDARLSRYSYLVSLLPASIVSDLGLRFRTAPRRIASYTPCGDRGVLVDNADPKRGAESFAAVTGGDTDWQAWQRFYAATGRLARTISPTMTEPLRSRAGMRAIANGAGMGDAGGTAGRRDP